MKSLKPFWGWMTLLPSPVDEAQLHSGLIVPTAYEGDDGVARAVVVDVHPHYDEWGIHSGDVVYYLRSDGLKIGDLILLKVEEVVAFEGAD